MGFLILPSQVGFDDFFTWAFRTVFDELLTPYYATRGADLSSGEGVTYLTWNKDELRKALAKDTHLREAFNTVLSRSVALKLNHTSRATVTEFAS